MFIRDTNDYKSLIKTLNLTDSAVAEFIIQTFPRFTTGEVPSDIEEKYAESETIFKSALSSLIEFREQCSFCVENFDIFESDLIVFLSELKEIGTIFTAKTSDSGNRENFFNPYVILLDWASAEILDLESILEAIESRKKYLNVIGKIESKLVNSRKGLVKIQSGKKSISQFFSKKSKEDLCSQSGKEIETLENDLKNTQICYKVMSIRLASKEISMFKLAKLETYKHIMKVFSTASIQELTVLAQQAQSLEYFIDSS